MVGDRLQPAAETERRVVGESTQLLRELEQDILGHVLGIRVLELPLPAPAVDVPAVMLHELVPGALVRRVLPQQSEQRQAGRGKSFRHRYYSPRGKNLAPYYCAILLWPSNSNARLADSHRSHRRQKNLAKNLGRGALDPEGSTRSAWRRVSRQQ